MFRGKLILLFISFILVSLILVFVLWKNSPEIHGKIVDSSGTPLNHTLVRIKNTEFTTITDQQGDFTFTAFPHKEKLAVTAWKHGYFISGSEILDPTKGILITLEAYPTIDNSDYSWISSFPIDDGLPEDERVCSSCHSNANGEITGRLPFDQWKSNRHSLSATDPIFFDVYNGTASGSNFPNFPGYKIDNAGSAGNCATCHAPGAAIDGPWSSDMNDLVGVETQGVFCDFCHKIQSVQLDPNDHLPFEGLTGTLSMELRRPPADQQLFFGPFDDVDLGPDSYLPLIRESAYCAPCHYAVFQGVPIYDSYSQWLDSSFAKLGITCQDCHMKPEGVSEYFALPSKGGQKRDEVDIFSHVQYVVRSTGFLEGAIKLDLQVEDAGGRVLVKVSIFNTGAGHSIPSEHPMRNMILLIQAKDSYGNDLEYLGDQFVPSWGGTGSNSNDYAGLIGKGFAKILIDLSTQESPSIAYWRDIEILSDTRIPADGQDISTYDFIKPNSVGDIEITAYLIYRDSFIDIAENKGWKVYEKVISQKTTRYSIEDKSDDWP